MTDYNQEEINLFKKACLCRAFETRAYKAIEDKQITIPIYLSAGHEYIASTIATYLSSKKKVNKQIFIQHRGHSTYLAFGGEIEKLIFELLGSKKGCAYGMGGSASIQGKDINLYGHDGLMGSQGPIATGACFGNKKFTLCFAGDAAAEEDYFLASLGWAVTKNLPIWFIIEDNNLSILTEKKFRRSWEMNDIARGFGMQSFNIDDDPKCIWNALETASLDKPALFNINTKRLFWHAGAGIDNQKEFDRHQFFLKKYENLNLQNSFNKMINEIWEKCSKNL